MQKSKLIPILLISLGFCRVAVGEDEQVQGSELGNKTLQDSETRTQQSDANSQHSETNSQDSAINGQGMDNNQNIASEEKNDSSDSNQIGEVNLNNLESAQCGRLLTVFNAGWSPQDCFIDPYIASPEEYKPPGANKCKLVILGIDTIKRVDNYIHLAKAIAKVDTIADANTIPTSKVNSNGDPIAEGGFYVDIVDHFRGAGSDKKNSTKFSYAVKDVLNEFAKKNTNCVTTQVIIGGHKDGAIAAFDSINGEKNLKTTLNLDNYYRYITKDENITKEFRIEGYLGLAPTFVTDLPDNQKKLVDPDDKKKFLPWPLEPYAFKYKNNEGFDMNKTFLVQIDGIIPQNHIISKITIKRIESRSTKKLSFFESFYNKLTNSCQYGACNHYERDDYASSNCNYSVDGKLENSLCGKIKEVMIEFKD